MKIDIVIPCNQPLSEVLPLLNSLNENWCPIVGEVLVVFNPSRKIDSSISADFRFPVRFLQSNLIGVNRARNEGIRAAASEIVLLLDSDCRVTDKGIFARHLKEHLNSDVVAVGGVYSNPKGQGTVAYAYSLLQRQWVLAGLTLTGQNWHLLGGHVSYKRRILLQHPFNESIVFGAAETELNFRLHQMGYRLVCDLTSSVLHENSLGFWGLLRRAVRQGLNAGRFGAVDQSTGLITNDLLNIERAMRSNRGVRLIISLYQWMFSIGCTVESKQSLIKFFFRKSCKSFYRRLCVLDADLDLILKRSSKRNK